MERIDSIPAGRYIGYYWMSDADKPVWIDSPDTEVSTLLNEYAAAPEANPFVIEGQLYDAESRVSISLKYVDGRYILIRYDVEPDDLTGASDSVTVKKYVAHRPTDKRLIFLQYWRERQDPLCCGMPVLQPAEKVFIGFEPLKESEK